MSTSSARRSRADPRAPGGRCCLSNFRIGIRRGRRRSADGARALRQRVLRPTETLDQIAAREDEAERFFGVERGGEVVAVGSVRPEGAAGSWRVRSMAVSDDERGEGLGAAVLEALTDFALERGAARLWCDARVVAIGFYERQGWKLEPGETFWVEGAGEHRVMARRLRD